MNKSKFAFFLLSIALLSVSLVGCSQEAALTKDEATDKTAAGAADDGDPDAMAAFAELSAEDHALAMAQKFCAAEPENLLGSMGTPVKIMIEGEPVFLCCAGCEEKALADPQQTLASAKQLTAAHEAGQ